MKRETAKRLLDAYTAAIELQQFIEGNSAESFDTDHGLQVIAHKLLEFFGEAFNGAKKSEPAIAERIPNLQRYIILRNRITHGYDTVDSGDLWVVARLRVADLIIVLEELMQEAPPPEQPWRSRHAPNGRATTFL